MELYKQCFTLADFFPKLGFSRGFLLLPLFCRKDQRSCDVRGTLYFFKVPRSSFIRDREIEGGEIEEGGCE